MSPLALILLSLGWSAVLWIGASLLCRLNPTPHQAQAIWRVAAGFMLLPFLVAPFLPDMRVGMGAAIPDLPLMEGLTVNPGAATVIEPAPWALPAWFTLVRIALLILAAGWVARMVAWLIGQSRLQSLKRQAQPSRLHASTWARALGLTQTPEVRLTPSGSPFVAGLSRPVVYLPRGLQPCAEVQQVIAHECVHLKRGDLVARPIERLVADLFWFSPFAWGMRSALDYWREAVVDADAVRLTGDRIAYARALTHTARLSRPVVHLPVAAFILPRKGTLKMRLTHVLHTQPRQPRRLAAAAVLAITLAVPVALAQGALMKGKTAVVAFTHPILMQARLTSTYGMRLNPITGEPGWHNGTDLAAPLGTPIYAPTDGTVSRAENSEGYGNLVVLDLADGRKLRFGQLDTMRVAQGDKVAAGEQIATVGESGKATGPHLHFEVWQQHWSDKAQKWDMRPDDPESVAGLELVHDLSVADGVRRSAPAGPAPDAPAPPAPGVPNPGLTKDVIEAANDACKPFENWSAERPKSAAWTARMEVSREANRQAGLTLDALWVPENVASPHPSYPVAAAENKISGACEVMFDLGTDGLPKNTMAACSDPVFVDEARALPGARFKPVTGPGGQPVEVKGQRYPLQFCIG